MLRFVASSFFLFVATVTALAGVAAGFDQLEKYQRRIIVRDFVKAQTPEKRRKSEGRRLRQRRQLQGDFVTCSDLVKSFGDARVGLNQIVNGENRKVCNDAEVSGMFYKPDELTYQSEYQMYTCPTSNKRIMVSNGIPDHDFFTSNTNNICIQKWMYTVPLNPEVDSSIWEPSAPGVVAFALNGVPIYGAQEVGGTNAIHALPNSTFTSVPYVGHAGEYGNWHYHSGEMGRQMKVQDLSSETLLGYAMDGFPLYGPTDDDLLDECGGRFNVDGGYQYHVRTMAQIDNRLSYCSDDIPEGAVRWGYIVGCFKGKVDGSFIDIEGDVTAPSLPEDCIQEDRPATNSPTPLPPHDDLPYSGSKPNFIVLQPDDLEFFKEWTPPPHLVTYGAKYFPFTGLPNMERLRKNGLTMKQAYTASPKCGTSRYSTVTGRYPSRSANSRKQNTQRNNIPIGEVSIPTTKLQDDARPEDGFDCSKYNIAAFLKQNQYRTGVTGKWHLSNSKLGGTPYSYEEFVKNAITECQFDFADGIYAENLFGDWNEDENGDKLFSHNMEWVAEKAIDFIKDTSSSDPFFLYINPTVPHSSGNVLEALVEPEFNCTVTPDGLRPAPVVKGMTEGTSCEAYRQSLVEKARGYNDNGNIGSMWLDDAIGSIFTALEDIGQLDNTFFLFQLDHGQEGKGTLYETGIRIPQFIHFPAAFSPGRQFDGLVSTIDIAATIADYAGLDESSPGYYKMDGKSWKSSVEGTGDETNKCLYFEMEFDRAVRCGCYKYMVLDEDSETRVQGSLAWQLSHEDTNFFNLCDDEEAYENWNTKEATQFADNSAIEELMADRLNCHIARTTPEKNPVFGLDCDVRDSVPSASPSQTPTTTTLCNLQGDCSSLQDFYQEYLLSRYPMSGEGFVAPTTTELEDIESIVTDMMEGACANIDLRSLAQKYMIMVFSEEDDTSTEYCILATLSKEAPFGTVIVNMAGDSARNLSFDAVYPVSDSNTGMDSVIIFKGTNARSLVISGAHPMSSATKSSCGKGQNIRISNAGNAIGGLQYACKAILQYFEKKGRDYTAIQFHKMGNTIDSCVDDDAFITSGVASVTLLAEDKPVVLRDAMVTALLNDDPLTNFNISVPTTSACSNDGTMNAQGRMINGVGKLSEGEYDADVACHKKAKSSTGRFIHLALRNTLRGALTRSLWIEAIIDAYTQWTVEDIFGG